MEARLERSQAEAKAQRAQQRLDVFLAERPAAQVLFKPVHLHLVPIQFHPQNAIPSSKRNSILKMHFHSVNSSAVDE